MTEHEVIVIGAGPSGLSAGLELARGGLRPLVLECSDGVGGLMRSYRHGDFIVDVGRKEMYARFPEVNDLWCSMLGTDYRPYPHRVGSLWRGRIIELSGRWRGPLRGIPARWLFAGGATLAAGWSGSLLRKPANLEAYWHGQVGSVFARILAQGYWEKFRGQRWADMPPPQDFPSHSLAVVGQAIKLARRGGVQGQARWRHPALGTGQLFERLAVEVTAAGGEIAYRNEVVAIRPRSDGQVELEVRTEREHRCLVARHVVTSLPIERLFELLPSGTAGIPGVTISPEAERHVLLLYLFLRRPPLFPHAWLEVNDPELSCGRITNYSAFGGEMVPDGRGCLCIETFCAASDPKLGAEDEEIAREAIGQVMSAALIEPGSIDGWAITRLARTNAAASWREAQSEQRSALLLRLSDYPSLYHVNRPGADWATLAGSLAGRAILGGSRKEFDRRADPALRHIDEEGDGEAEVIQMQVRAG